jgi:hypothetical protein
MHSTNVTERDPEVTPDVTPEVTIAPGFGAFAPLPDGAVPTQHGPVRAMFSRESGNEIAHRLRFEIAWQYPPRSRSDS